MNSAAKTVLRLSANVLVAEFLSGNAIQTIMMGLFDQVYVISSKYTLVRASLVSIQSPKPSQDQGSKESRATKPYPLKSIFFSPMKSQYTMLGWFGCPITLCL